MHEDCDVSGACANIHQHHAQLALVAGQHRGAGTQRGEDQIVHLQAAALHALADVGGSRLRADHEVRMHFKPHAGHADRVADAFLRIVQHVIPRDRMQDLLVGRDRHCLGRFKHAVEIGIADLAVTDRHDAGRVAALHVIAGNRRVDRTDLAAGHQLGFFDCALDRLHGGFDVDHHAALQPARFMRADADDFDGIARRILADQRHHFRCADVEADDQRFVALAVHVVKPKFLKRNSGFVV